MPESFREWIEADGAVVENCRRADIDRLLLEPFAPLSCRVISEERWTADGDGGPDGEPRSAVKLVVRLADGNEVETVVLKHRPPPAPSLAAGAGAPEGGARGTRSGSERATVCVSSQVGCRMMCSFCATGTMGLTGNLLAGEILEQVVLAGRYAEVRNVVFMGMGEPLDNYENVLEAVAALTDSSVFNLSSRHVTISTVGVAPLIRRLARDNPRVGLALSLHAPNQELRREIVPPSRRDGVEELMAAVDHYLDETAVTRGRRGIMMQVREPPSVNAIRRLAAHRVERRADVSVGAIATRSTSC